MKNNALIGFSGFVGSNLETQHTFNFKYNSKNISHITNKSFDLVVCCGVSANKWWADENPIKDRKNIDNLISYLRTITCKMLVLISTIDVYNSPLSVDENSTIDFTHLKPYGLNRLYFENFIRDNFENHLIIRLPALFGNGLKKNFLFDLAHPIPSIIKGNKFNEIIQSSSKDDIGILMNAYESNSDNNYSLKNPNNDVLKILKANNFTSYNFTDYRSVFQFYDLSNLNNDIAIALKNNIKLLNLATEPMSAAFIAKEALNLDFINTINDKTPLIYNFKSIYSHLFNGKDGYLYSKDIIIENIKLFLKEQINETWNL